MRALDALTHTARAFIDLHRPRVLTAGVQPQPLRAKLAEGMIQQSVKERGSAPSPRLIQRDAEQLDPARRLANFAEDGKSLRPAAFPDHDPRSGAVQMRLQGRLGVIADERGIIRPGGQAANKAEIRRRGRAQGVIRPEDVAALTPWADAWRRFKRHRLAYWSLWLLGALVLAVLVGPMFDKVGINDIDFQA